MRALRHGVLARATSGAGTVNPNLIIVTIVRDDAPGLARTTRSILKMIEATDRLVVKHVVIDCASKDAPLTRYQEILAEREYPRFSSHTQSSRDEGIFDAMNKASECLIEGAAVWYLNAGDVVHPDLNFERFEARIFDLCASQASLLFFVAECKWEQTSWLLPPPRVMGDGFPAWISRHTPVHQAVLFRASRHYPIHYPRVFFRTEADTALIYYLLKFQGTYLLSPEVVCTYSLGGISNDYRKASKVLRQTLEEYAVYWLRGQDLGSYVLLPVIMVSKYILHSALGRRFHSLHAAINRWRFR
jgi:hypothetical protein